MREKLSAIRNRLTHLPGQHRTGGRKKLLAILAAVVIVIGLCIFGATRIYNRYHGGTVNVYSFTDVGLDAMMVEDGMDMEGTVSTDQLQTEYLSDSEKVDKVYVKKGQKVKEGDKLFSYDSTLTKLDLQRKNIEIQKKELALTEAKKRLSVIKTYRAGVPIKNSVADDIGNETIDSGDDEDDSEDETAGAFDAGVTNLASIRTLGGDSDRLTQEEIRPLSGSGTKDDPYNYEWDDNYIFNDSFLEIITQGKTEAYVRFFLSGSNAGLEEKQQELEQLQQQLNELEETIDSMQAEWDAKEEQLQSDLEEAQGQLEQSRSDLQDSQTEIQELKNLAGQIVAYFLDLSSESEDENKKQLFDDLKELIQNAESADDLKQKLEAFLKQVEEMEQPEITEDTGTDGDAASSEPVDGTDNTTDSPDTDSADEQEIVVADQSMEDSTIQAVAQTLEARRQSAQVKPLGETEEVTVSENSEDGDAYFASWVMHIQQVNGSYRYRILSINVGGLERDVADSLPEVENPTEPGEEPGDEPGDVPSDEPGGGFTDGIVYTRAQLAQLITQASEEVKTLERDLKKLRIEYRKQQIEADADTVYAKVDGVVTTLRDPDKAGTEKAFIKVSGDGAGYKISGTVSELELDRAMPGASVTVNNEEIGESYQGVVEKVLKYPTESNEWDYTANSNVSYYPFTVKVDDSAEFNLDDYITISFDKTEEETASVYLMKCFIRSEDGRSYIYVADEDGKLEKRYVSTGKDVWGNYTEIKNGLSEGEMVAFPYGQHVREGAPTQEASIEALYTE
ncbi:MAG: biotin/lipoyl-binding protein [Clostridiales bacterium]|nr:biotin/lipoyl-binding protein [Clostridiales bacterium]